MRKQSSLTEVDKTAIDLTPMLDVVFIMLIFFIVTATFIKEPGIKVIKPEATTAIVQKRTSILIAINSDQEVWVDRKKVDVRGLTPVIERLFSESPKGSVVIQADKNSEVETLTRVMQATKAAGVRNIAISAEQ